MNNSRQPTNILSILVACSVFVGAARASAVAPVGSHLWVVNEIFSNADGTVQFIELKECCGASFETGLAGKHVFSIANSFIFPANLTGDTANRHLLLGTAAFAAQPGAPTPDHIIQDNFFATGTDSIRWFVYSAPTLTFFPGDLPMDGLLSLNQDLSTSPNSPTNYSDQTGQINLVPGTAEVLQVTSTGTQGSFTTIQAAVDAAQDGDTILVGAGTYASFQINGKSLFLLAVPGAQVVIDGQLTLSNLALEGTVVVIGLEFRPTAGRALLATANLGHVRFQDCEFHGASAVLEAALLDTNPSIAFVRCLVQGADGSAGDPAMGAGDAVTSLTSAAMFYDCEVNGGEGGMCPAICLSVGGDGGTAFTAPDWGLIAAGTTFLGGKGGDCEDFLDCFGGDGGDAVVIGVDARAELLENTLLAGAEGCNICPVGGASCGAPGSQTTGGGPIHNLASSSRVFEPQASIVPAGRFLQVTVQGEPGDSVYLPLSDRTHFGFKPSFFGVWLVPPRSIIPLSVWPTGAQIWPLPLAVIPASGSTTISVRMPVLGPDEPSRFVFLQGYILNTAGKPVLGSPIHVFVPNCGVLVPDCDSNGLFDGCDVVLGIDPDVDSNGIPDVCGP